MHRFSLIPGGGWGVGGSSLVKLHWLPIAVVSLVAEHRALECMGFCSCSPRAELLCDMWDLSEPGIKLVSPTLQGRFLTTVPSGKGNPGLNF